jgi:hypothetical protein
VGLVEPLLVPPQSPVKRVPWHSRGASGAAPHSPRPARGSGVAPGHRAAGGAEIAATAPHETQQNGPSQPRPASPVVCRRPFAPASPPWGAGTTRIAPMGPLAALSARYRGGPELGTPPQNRCFCDTSASSRPSWFAKPARGLNRSTTERKYTKFQPRRRRPCSPSRYPRQGPE